MNSAEDLEEDRRSLILFLLGSCGYEEEADRVARVSKRILESEQIVEGISRFQFPRSKRTRLMYAAIVGNLVHLNFIAGLGARVNMTGRGVHSLLGNWTALHFASDNGHTECVRSLLDRGAMIDAQTEYGWTALHLACYGGHLDVVRLLCERGAQMDQQIISGGTALYWASFKNRIDIARYLCERGANTLLKSNGETPYTCACTQYGADSPIALLLKAYPH
jgi:ankyrin repeat protein